MLFINKWEYPSSTSNQSTVRSSCWHNRLYNLTENIFYNLTYILSHHVLERGSFQLDSNQLFYMNKCLAYWHTSAFSIVFVITAFTATSYYFLLILPFKITVILSRLENSCFDQTIAWKIFTTLETFKCFSCKFLTTNLWIVSFSSKSPLKYSHLWSCSSKCYCFLQLQFLFIYYNFSLTPCMSLIVILHSFEEQLF